MKTVDILKLDGLSEYGYEIINKALTKIFDGDEDYKTTQMLEKKIFEFTNEYLLDVKCLITDCRASDRGIVYRMCYQSGKSTFNMQHIYGNSIWEVMAKAVICFFSLIKKGDVRKREV